MDLTIISFAPVIAYIDPGTGAFILQAVVAVVVGAIAVVKGFGKSIKAIIFKPFTKDEESK